MDKLKMHSKDLSQDNLAKIQLAFPNCITERQNAQGQIELAVDFDLLRQELSANIVEGPQERYRLDWPGKREAMLTANAPIAKTLRPARDESVNFDETENLFIEGDNLDALKLLQENYLGKVKMIYIDPPYNTGNDFIYKDIFSTDTERYQVLENQVDSSGNKLVSNPQTNGRFHSDWLSMIYARIKLARNLLREDGVMFVSIDDNEQSNLKRVCDEIFGESNFIGLFVVNASPSGIDYGHLAKTHDYALFYAKDIVRATTNQLKEESKEFRFKDEDGGFNIYPLYNGNVAFNPTTRPNLHYPFYLNTNNNISDNFYEISIEKKDNWIAVWPVISRKEGVPRVWRWGKIKAQAGLNEEIIGYKSEGGDYRIVQKSRHTTKVIRSILLDNEVSSRRGTGDFEKLFKGKYFSFPKSVDLIKRFIEVGSSDEDIVLDFFAGSATTAQSIFKLNSEDGGNRRFILVQLSENVEEKHDAYKAGYKTIAEISKERIRRAGQQILEGESHEDWKKDIGFRVLKVDTSNMQDVYYQPQQLNQDDLLSSVDNIKADRTNEDLLFQVLLDWGVDLTLPIRHATLQGKELFIVDDSALVACFEQGISEELINELAALNPLRAVFRDNGFVSDAVKVNVTQIFKQRSPITEVKAI